MVNAADSKFVAFELVGSSPTAGTKQDPGQGWPRGPFFDLVDGVKNFSVTIN